MYIFFNPYWEYLSREIVVLVGNIHSICNAYCASGKKTLKNVLIKLNVLT